MFIDGIELTQKPYTYGVYPGKTGAMCTDLGCLDWFRKSIKQRNIKTFLEIGTFDGIMISVLAEENPNVFFHVVDPFIAGHNTGGGHFEYFLVNNFKNDNIYLYKKTSKEALPDILGLFDMVFIDGSHSYDDVKYDTETAYDLLNPNGLIAFHDYDHADVKLAIDEFCNRKNLQLTHDTQFVTCTK